MRKERKQKTGASRMIELGYKQVQVWLDKKELEAIQKRTGMRLAAYLRKLACDDCEIPFYYR